LAFFYVSVIKKVKRESIKAALAVDWTSKFGSSPSAEFVANGLCRLMLSKLKTNSVDAGLLPNFEVQSTASAALIDSRFTFLMNGVKYEWIDSGLNQLMAEPDEWWSKQWITLRMYDQGDPSTLMHATAHEALMLQTHFQETHFELSTIVTTCPLQTGQMPPYTDGADADLVDSTGHYTISHVPRFFDGVKALDQPPKPTCPPEASAILLLMTQDLHLEGMLMPIVLPVLAKYEVVFKVVLVALYSWLGLEAILLVRPMVIVVQRPLLLWLLDYIYWLLLLITFIWVLMQCTFRQTAIIPFGEYSLSPFGTALMKVFTRALKWLQQYHMYGALIIWVFLVALCWSVAARAEQKLHALHTANDRYANLLT
jgi:hypothetical protein